MRKVEYTYWPGAFPHCAWVEDGRHKHFATPFMARLWGWWQSHR